MSTRTSNSNAIPMQTLSNTGPKMNWLRTCAAILSIAAFVLGGCAVSQDDVVRVQTNLVDKSIFEGEWWYATTIVDVRGDEARVLGSAGPFSGDMSLYDLGVDSGGLSFTMARIRWVIDENFLYAYRAYELVDGGNDNGRADEFRGQPLAAWRISNHVDVRRDFNQITGEESNVIIENATDRRWYERDFMRVDWSQNLVTPFYGNGLAMARIGGQLMPESVPFFFQENATGEFPESYAPQFVRVAEDPNYRFAADWPSDLQDTVHYMSFVTREIWAPGANCLFQGTTCASAGVTVRNSFLRVPPNHEYAVDTQNNDEFDRFGLFRQMQRTYVRGGQSRDTVRRFCRSDDDCNGRGVCSVDQHICIGGISSDIGETDSLTFYRPRHNFFENSLSDKECVVDWECDGRFPEVPGTPGSICDQRARRCTTPVAERPIHQVSYHLSKHFPPYLVRSSFQTVGDWNEVFMRGLRGAKNQPLATGPRVACQNSDPTQYCWCGSAEVDAAQDNTCAWKYDPFQSPDEAEAAGVENPYQCHIQGPADVDHPTSYEQYTAEAYGYTFVGDECMFVLKVNSCDVDPTAECEELGDIRYQFFNLITHGSLQFGGVALPMSDPKTGELIVANANMGQTSLDSVATSASQFFQVLRGEFDEELYFNNAILRGYYDRLGNTERPVSLASSGTDGHSTGDPSRPGLPRDLTSFISSQVASRADRVNALRGTEGRALIFSDRMRNLAGTSVEGTLVEALGRDALTNVVDTNRLPSPDMTATDARVINQVSPFRTSLADAMNEQQRRVMEMARLNMDPMPTDRIYNSANWQYWADQFAADKVPGDLTARNREASIRMQQAFIRSYMLHEIGHAVGLRHNFAGSYDRNNYYDGYYRIAREHPLPSVDNYDDAEQGGNANGQLDELELDKWQRDLRAAREARNAKGSGNVMSGSIMDYPGDLSDLSGLGRYDAAATMWSYFNVIEVYNGNPTFNARTTSTTADSSLDGIDQPDRVSRSIIPYYRGGDWCQEDSDCPAAEGRNGEGSAVYQRCIRNPRVSTSPVACDGDRNCVCSNVSSDLTTFVSGGGYRDGAACTEGDNSSCGEFEACIDSNPTTAGFQGRCMPMQYPVKYLYCNDERTFDVSWCSAFDAGESFQETVDHYRRAWTQSYPNAYYRHYRASGAATGNTWSYVTQAVKIYQHFLFRYFYEPSFLATPGALGVNDQYQASIDTMNWLSEIASMPDVGSYALDADANIYRKISDEPGLDGADISLSPGEGYNMWSAYQRGYSGYFRIERGGVFFDKFLALYALALRNWNFSYSYDERFYINFYDFFQSEMSEYFGGYIRNDPRTIGPRLTTVDGSPRVQYVSLWRGSDRCGTTGYEPCRPNIDENYPDPAVDSTSNNILRSWAAILALAQFPVYYDPTFEQRLSVFKLGAGNGFTLPTTHSDGSPYCARGDSGCTNPDYVVYTSDRLGTSYVAVLTRSDIYYNVPETNVGYNMLAELQDKQERIADLEGSSNASEIAERDRLIGEVTETESFLEYLIEVQSLYGISSI